MKNMNEENKNLEILEKVEEVLEKVEELDDDMLDDVAGGLVQLINPSSSRL